MIAGVLGTPGARRIQVGSGVDDDCSWPVSVCTVTYPRPSASARSVPLTETFDSEPQLLPQPTNRNRLFQVAGSLSSNRAEPGPAPSPSVATASCTAQNSGVVPTAGTSVTEAIVTWGTFNPESVASEQFASAAAAGATPHRLAMRMLKRMLGTARWT